jgi:transcriptional regulator with PAS, ATPase and Fis domain
VPVLIVGESGTGKELVARAIHEQSCRSQMPLVCLNLAAVPLELAETVLFGHQKGAFTGAVHASPGYCRKADRGTLFLDEIGEADLALQAKLLRFLQNGEIQPVGSESTVTVDARIVAATNRELDIAVRDKQFREDLFYRLNVIQITLPALRERPEDVDDLIDLFLKEFNLKYGRECEFSAPLRECFFNAQWPGNIRQLRSLVESLVLLSEYDVLGLHDLSSEFLAQIGTRASASDNSHIGTDVPELDRLTRHLVESVLEQSKGHVTVAAQRLGVSKSTLYRWIKRYDSLKSETPVDTTLLGFGI